MTSQSRTKLLWTTLVGTVLAATLTAACGGGPSVSSKGKSGDGQGGTAGTTGEGGEGTGGTTIIQPPPDCVPKTCEELEKNCGSVADGCGTIVECGGCRNGHVCGLVTPNVCSTNRDIDDLCQKVSKTEACRGKECGVEGDGCGGTYDCGTCDMDEACGIMAPFRCDPRPGGDDDDCPTLIDSCADEGAECGFIGNGCGGVIDCDMETGGCMNGQVCGLGGPQQCGAPPTCTPFTAAAACAGKCGIVSNGCGVEVNGGVIDCSQQFPCPMGQTCGGGGTPNQCGSGGNACQPIPQATACSGKACGAASNGCTSSYTCGSCGTGQSCIDGQCQGSTCTPIPQATACAGKECGQVGNGCQGTYDCGTCPMGEQCGQRTAFTCDPDGSICTPRTPQAACSGKQCGIVYDGCGTGTANQIDCGQLNGGCQNGEFCGLNQPFQCGTPNVPPCVPTATSCAALGWQCGQAVNNCGTVYDCASEGRTCNGLQTCVGGISGPATCQSSGGSTCPLCSSVPNCTGQSQLTRLTGRVVTPGKTDGNTPNQLGVPNAFVYILRTNDLADLPAIGTGLPGSNGTACERCTDQDLGPVLVSGMTNATGYYQLEGNIPVGAEFILVVKVGKFRRAVRHTLPGSAACTTTNVSAALPANLTRLPRNQTDGLAVNIPKIAVSTGEVDAMECVLQRMGLANSEFTRPQLTTGRVHLYRANGAWPDQNSEDCDDCSSSSCRSMYCGGSTTSARTAYLNALADQRLFEDNGRISEYDMVVFDCEGGGWDSSFNQRNNYGDNVRNYVNRGGRLFGSHWSYSWIDGNGSLAYAASTSSDTGLSAAGTWTSGGSFPNSGTGAVALGRPLASPRIQNFADWMDGHSIATSPNYTFAITEPRGQNTGLGSSSEEFVYRTDGDMRTQQMSFNTPYAAPAAAICGRVAYSGFHVSVGTTTNQVFPNHCTGDLTAQEKVLLYMLFDLGACVGEDPDPPGCTTQACPGGGLCGTRPDGCGGTQQCGCPQGQACINGGCQPQGCVPTSCAAEGIICSTISDGCGGSLACSCPVCTPITQAQACAGVTCGYRSDGCSGVYNCGGACGPSCTPLNACPQGIECGVISDGCSGTLNCGMCQPPGVCGGTGQPNRCGIPMCDPLTCDDLGAECGMVGDGCGGSADCGPCPAGQFCTTVNGMQNRCDGCVPQDCNDVGAECGTVGDGCGGTVDCGPCPQGQICGAQSPNQCGMGGGCTPLTCNSVGAECGIIGDGCGGQRDCGDCPSGQLCGIDEPFQCGDIPDCTPATCASLGADCGLIGDGCGELLDCGNCSSGQTCGLAEPNKCAGVR